MVPANTFSNWLKLISRENGGGAVFGGRVRWGRGGKKGLLLGNQSVDRPPLSPRQPLPLTMRPDELSGPGAVCACVLGAGVPRWLHQSATSWHSSLHHCPTGRLRFSFVLNQSTAHQFLHHSPCWRREMYGSLPPCQEGASLAACVTQGYALWTISHSAMPLNKRWITCRIFLVLSASNLHLNIDLLCHVPLKY